MKSKPFTVEDLERKGFQLAKNGQYEKLIVTHIAEQTITAPMLGIGEALAIRKTSRPKAKLKIPNAKAKGLQAIERVLKASNIEYVTEYKFDAHRKFRFDVFMPSLKCGIEYEGIFSTKSRHTSLGGYSTDIEKYNLCQLNGLKVLRYTAMNYKNFVEDLKRLL